MRAEDKELAQDQRSEFYITIFSQLLENVRLALSAFALVASLHIMGWEI